MPYGEVAPPPPCTRQVLDVLRCATPGCRCVAPLHLCAKCHPDAPVEALYYAGVVTLVCGQCARRVLGIQVADAGEVRAARTGA